MPNGIPSEKPQNRYKGGFRGGIEATRATQFKPGNRANPGGRPKKKPITEMFEKILSDTGNMELVARAVMETLESKGMAKVLLLDKMADRVEGKVKDELELSVKDGLAEQISKFRKKKNGNAGS